MDKDSEAENDSPDKLERDLSMKEVADLVLQTLEGYKIDGEPFEVYAQKLKSHIHSNPDLFRHRFKEGYETILTILSESELDQESD